MRLLAAAAVTALVSASCARPTPARLIPGPAPSVRLGEADALLASGCLDCFADAYRAYTALAAEPSVHLAAQAGAVRAALLASLREHEIGLPDGDWLSLAREQVDPASDLNALVVIAETLTALPRAQRSTTVRSEIAASRELSRRQAEWTALLSARVAADATAAYLWLTMVCAGRVPAPTDDERTAAVGETAAMALIRYKEATACRALDGEAIDGLLAAEPRTRELHYYRGLAASSGSSRRDTPRGQMDVDGAGLAFDAAYSWRQDWPALALARGNVALAAEDYPAALAAFDEALRLIPGDPEALLGGLRSLTYLGRHDEGVARADELLAANWSPGDARYWRALNEHGLRRYDEAWTDVETAATFLINADVPKLGGLIALALGRVPDARARFELARRRRPADCEAGYYLQAVLATQREWEGTARVAADAAGCMDREEQRLTIEIAGLQVGTGIDPARRDRQIASRENQLRGLRRQRAAAWFNAAVGHFNLARAEPARAFAMRLIDDDDFSARARDLIARLDAR